MTNEEVAILQHLISATEAGDLEWGEAHYGGAAGGASVWKGRYNARGPGANHSGDLYTVQKAMRPPRGLTCGQDELVLVNKAVVCRAHPDAKRLYRLAHAQVEARHRATREYWRDKHEQERQAKIAAAATRITDTSK